MRPFSDADLVQSSGGTGSAVSSVDMTVPAATAEGNAGIVVSGVTAPFNPPEQWDISAADPSGQLKLLTRADLPGGESDWPVTALVNTNWVWAIGEWANVSSAPIASTVASSGVAAPSSYSTGTTGTWDAEFVMGFAAFLLVQGGAGGSAWPSVSYDSSFTETDSQQVGDGTASGNLLIKVARRYGTDGEAGPWSCTATFTGTMTGKSVYGLLAVFNAVATADVPAGVLSG